MSTKRKPGRPRKRGRPRQGALMHCAKDYAAHALIKELTGSNAAARVAAARTLLEDNDRNPAGHMPQVPGFAILIADARSSHQPVDITPLAPRLEADRGG